MFLLRSCFLLAALSHVAVGVKITIESGDSNAASTPGAPLPVIIEGLSSAPECTFGNGDDDDDFAIELNGQGIAYNLAETEPNFWYGKEQTDDDSGDYAFLYFASDPAVPDKCLVFGTVGSRTAGVRMVFKTHSDGGMWASVLTADELGDAVWAEPGGAAGSASSLPLDKLLVEGRQQEADVIDMMVVATREAVCGQNGQPLDCTITAANLAVMQLQINFLMLQVNQVLRNSQIDLTMRRVGPITFDQGDFEEDGYNVIVTLQQMLNCNLGNLCELRAENCADIVHLLPFTRDRGIVGVASDIGPNPDAWAVITTLENNANALLVFSHEVGHMIGGRHENDGSTPAVTFDRAFIDLENDPPDYVTVMTQGPECFNPATCTRVPFFSTPLDLDDGRVLGSAQNADNRRVVISVKGEVADYIDAAQCVLTPAPTLAPTPNPTPAPTPNPTPAPTPAPTGQPTIVCTSQEVRVTVDVNTDNWNHDSGFELMNADTSEMELKKAIGDYPFPNFLFVDQVCLGAGTYTITALDDWGDGICCDSGNGFFQLFIGDDEEPAFSTASEDFKTLSFTFDIEIAPSASPSEAPSGLPSAAPSSSPSEMPSNMPSATPSVSLKPSTSIGPSAAPSVGSTISDIVCNGDDFPQFEKLCELITRFGLLDDFDEGTWTLFAPTNEAIEEVEGTLGAFEKATETLLFHAVSGSVVASTDLECNGFLTMANDLNSQTFCNGDEEPVFQVGPDNGDEVSFPAFVDLDIPAFNGILHSVNHVLLFEGFFTEEPSEAPSMMPSECRTIAEIVCSETDFPQFSDLCELLTERGLLESLETGEWTLFAPINDGFDEIEDILGGLNNEQVVDLLQFHLVARRTLFIENLTCDEALTMANGDDSTTLCSNDGDRVSQKGDGNPPPPPPNPGIPAFVDTDIGACNGVVHGLNGVMLPGN